MNARSDQIFTEEEIAQTRSAAQELLDRAGLSKAAAARQADIKESTFAAWLAGTYQGRSDKIAEQVALWMSSREAMESARTSVPEAPDFVATGTAQEIADVLRWAQIGPDIVVITGGAGTGKTTACEHYAAHTPHVWLATADPSTAGVHGTMVSVASALRVEERGASKLVTSIADRLRGVGGLIIVDEAQHLTLPALEQLRSLHDKCAVGVALVGNEIVYGRIQGEGRKPELAQLFSRVGMRMTKPRPEAADICALIKAWGITDEKCIATCKAIAGRPGALRVMTKTLRLATMLARGSEAPVSYAHITQAYKRLSESGVGGGR